MARRTVLTSRQRSALFALPQREADLLRHYTLSDEDLQNIGARRRAPTKIDPAKLKMRGPYAALDANPYPTGVKVTEAEMDAISLVRDEFHGDWNYQLVPR